MATSADGAGQSRNLCLGKRRYFFRHHALRLGSMTVKAFSSNAHAAERDHSLRIPCNSHRLQR